MCSSYNSNKYLLTRNVILYPATPLISTTILYLINICNTLQTLWKDPFPKRMYCVKGTWKSTLAIVCHNICWVLKYFVGDPAAECSINDYLKILIESSIRHWCTVFIGTLLQKVPMCSGSNLILFLVIEIEY
jgi:hypothetical protein